MLGIIIQARLGSTRLPEKMILPFYKEQGVLEIILNKIIKGVPNVPIIVATTTSLADDEIIEVCKKVNVSYYRGSENNVLDRFIKAANKNGFSKIIRICADNPFLDIPSLKSLIKGFENDISDYYSFKTSEGKPTILTHYGFWAEGVNLEALKNVINNTEDPKYLEHVTNYIHSNPDKYRIKLIPIPTDIEKVTNLRLTLDTDADYIILKEIYAACIERNNNTALEVVGFLKNNKNWLLQMKEQIKINTK